MKESREEMVVGSEEREKSRGNERMKERKRE